MDIPSLYHVTPWRTPIYWRRKAPCSSSSWLPVDRTVPRFGGTVSFSGRWSGSGWLNPRFLCVIYCHCNGSIFLVVHSLAWVRSNPFHIVAMAVDSHNVQGGRVSRCQPLYNWGQGRQKDKRKKKSCPCNSPWRPIRLWYLEAPTFSRQLPHRWQWGCQTHSPAALYPQEDSWYSFLLEAESTPGP
jgi:hypothetical protein